MKKLTLILLAVILGISLIGCNKQQEPELCGGIKFDGVEYDYEEFMAIYGQGTDASLNDTVSIQTITVPNLLIPKLKIEGYYCERVLAEEVRYQYRYLPVDSSIMDGIDLKISDGDSGFYFARDNGDSIFANDTEGKYNSTKYISDECAHNESLNRWHMYKFGKSIMIDFPDSIKFTDPERISDYFEFEVLNPSTDNTVTE